MCGLPGRAASGAMVQGYVVEFMADIFGVEWLGNGSFNLKFVPRCRLGTASFPGLGVQAQGMKAAGRDVT